MNTTGVARSATAPPTRTVAASNQERNEEKRCRMLIRVLMKYLEKRDPPLHARAKVVIKECCERNENGDPAYESLTGSMKAKLNVTVGETYWRRAQFYLDHIFKQKEEKRARAARQQLQPLQRSQNAPATAAVGARSLKKGPKPKSPSSKKDSKPKSAGKQEDNKKEFGKKECVVCLEAAPTHVFVPCGHMCACKSCSSQVMGSRKLCPICNQPSTTAIKVFEP